MNSSSYIGNLASSFAARTERAPGEPTCQKRIDEHGRAYATGKRKDAIARVWIKSGAGRITVNGRDYSEYFNRAVLRMILRQPIIAAQRDGQFDIVVTVTGGGLSGQAGAVRHGIAKALTYYDPSLRQVLRRGGFLTRDSRVVERKMYRKAQGPPLLSVL